MAQMGNRDKWVLARYWWAYQADSYLAALTAYGPAPCLRAATLPSGGCGGSIAGF